MKKIFKWTIPALASCLFIWGFLHTCTYDYMTHLNGDEIAWATNRHEGEIMYLTSHDGITDTVSIGYVYVNNSIDPINWAYFNIGRQGYYGSARVKYYGNHSGELCVYKSDDGSIYFDSYVDQMQLWDVPLNITSLEVDGKTLNDVIFFDNTNSKPFNQNFVNDQNDNNRIITFAWSKKYGLVQYTLEDGAVFNRIELNDDDLKKTRWFPLNS